MPLADLPPQPPLAQAVAVEVALTAEHMKVAEGSRMGLVGLHYLRAVTPEWRLGASVFGAVTGDRGGFFGWGLSTAYRWHDGPWSAEAGLFVGGAGGSPVWVGGGLMLRPHLGLAHQDGPWRLGLGVSQVWFPNGSVRGSQPYASLNWSGDLLVGPAGGGEGPGAGAALKAVPTETAGTLGRYRMRNGSPRRDGSGAGEPLRVGGLVYRRALAAGTGSAEGVQPYWLISTAGSLSAQYAGYAELLGGAGACYALPFYPALSLRAEAALGAGGAGTSVDTGGGLLGKLGAGLSWQLGRQLSLGALASRAATRGRFEANEFRLELAYRGWDGLPLPAPEQADAAGPVGALRWTPWSFSAGWAQTLRAPRDDGHDPGLGVAALKLERELGPHWRLVGQAAIATNGRAGGFAAGQLGLGWLSGQAGEGWRFGAEASLGAAGGGGVKVGGGLVGQAQLQARRALSPSWSLQADAGWQRSRHGDLSSPLLGLSAVYSFSRLQAP